MTNRIDQGITLNGTRSTHDLALSDDALRFVAKLQRKFSAEVARVLQVRSHHQAHLDTGALPRFRPDTRNIRNSSWRVNPLPTDLINRQVSVAGPVKRKLLVNGLNSGAMTYDADLEDSLSPTWSNIVEAHEALRLAVRNELEFDEAGKHYQVRSNRAVLQVRPRGLHLTETHLVVDGSPVWATLFDIGMFLFHCGSELVADGSGPYLWLPKLEHWEEAVLLNEVLDLAEQLLELPASSTRVTVIIETVPAAYEIDELLHAFRTRATSAMHGPWDYLASYIMTLRAHTECVLPDRNSIPVSAPMLQSFAQLLVDTCHRRGVPAIGTCAAFIPRPDDKEATERALREVEEETRLHVKNGFDGTLVVHPELVSCVADVFATQFNAHPYQIEYTPDNSVDEKDLLSVPHAPLTEFGLRSDARIAIHYFAGWLKGHASVAIDNLMEGAARVEICRMHLWQVAHHAATLDDGRAIDLAFVQALISEEGEALRKSTAVLPDTASALPIAQSFLEDLTAADELEPYALTLLYPMLDQVEVLA